MKKEEEMLLLLNDLVKINYERIDHYERAASALSDDSRRLKDILYSSASLGRRNVNELHAEIIKAGGLPVPRTQGSGRIYACWKQQELSFTNLESMALPAQRELMEKSIIKVYEQVLLTEHFIPYTIRSLIRYQQHLLQTAKKISAGSLGQPAAEW